MCWFPVCTNNIKRKHWVSKSRVVYIIRSCTWNIYICIKRLLKQRKPPSEFKHTVSHDRAAQFSSHRVCGHLPLPFLLSLTCSMTESSKNLVIWHISWYHGWLHNLEYIERPYLRQHFVIFLSQTCTDLIIFLGLLYFPRSALVRDWHADFSEATYRYYASFLLFPTIFTRTVWPASTCVTINMGIKSFFINIFVWLCTWNDARAVLKMGGMLL